jgi:uncharacterized protein (TIGR02646 family)
MRYINKPQNPPQKDIEGNDIDGVAEFLQGATEHKQNILVFERNASTKLNETWFQKSQTVLLNLYDNKCAFCERIFSNDAENTKPTVEHFRPKNKMLYYWLAVEWTNLLPTCKGCNSPKGDKFPLTSNTAKVKTPFDSNNQLDESYFDAKILNAIENPLLLHPEIDNPKNFLFFDEDAKLKAIANNVRGIETIKLLELNDGNKRESLVLKRKKVLDDIRKDLEYQIRKIYNLEKEGKIIDNETLALALDRDFEKIISNAYNEQVEFTLLHRCIFFDFATLISEPIVKKLTENLDIEYKEQAKLDVSRLLNNSFVLFLERNYA